MTDTELSGRPDAQTPAQTGGASGAAASPADAAAAWRWACCLHESGHAAYAIIECCATPAYLIATAQAGLCGNVRPASAFQAGVFAAVGSIAEKIEAPRPPPAAPAPASWDFLPRQLSTPEAVLAVAVDCLSDSEQLARCVVSGAFADHPETWLARRAAILQAAADFVETNAGAIVALARVLAFRGALSGSDAAAILNNTPRRMTNEKTKP
jgi:hypothetical protein